MCKENRILELGKIFVSRRILAELTTEKINEVISWHQNGCIIMLGNKDWIEKPPHPLSEIVMNFYQADNGKDTIQLSTSVDDDGNRTTKISFSDESEDEQRGHFDWDICQSKRTPLKLGDVSCTICAKQLLGMPTIHRLIEKQLGYDWGATSVEDWIENDHAVEKDKRIVSQHFIDGENVFIITEADRSSTTIMLGYEY